MIKAEPGGSSGDEFYTHEGDSITLKCSTPHRWYNSGDVTSISIWAITPLSFYFWVFDGSSSFLV
jgi:hypothetical protein